jgi:hypothetical protein
MDERIVAVVALLVCVGALSPVVAAVAARRRGG